MCSAYTNALIHETSPYLLQHAHNPVHWEAWKPEVLERAQKEDKPLLISIGYAACHWCHVMEALCFEDEAVARLMNANFINIKVDREERPDVDQIYMDALHMLSGRGGWPLNIVALPNGKPFWGATYLSKDDWINALHALAQLYKKDKAQVVQYAERLSQGIRAITLVESKPVVETYSLHRLEAAITAWSQRFDTHYGGDQHAPKFMMPIHWDFLLHHATATHNPTWLQHVNTTLNRMACGGVYDPVGGGFARYAVDTQWHIPHFEKMLYDNAQLMSLYAKAYAVTQHKRYKKVVEQTLSFVQEELQAAQGGYYASLDADSANAQGKTEEGAYYVWTEEELQALLNDDFELFKTCYNINAQGHWEHGKYVLIQNATDAAIAQRHGISISTLNAKRDKALSILKAHRAKRAAPKRDDKIITAWNGLMLKGLVEAHRYLDHPEALRLALDQGAFIVRTLLREDASLFRCHTAGKSHINAFLEDYATVMSAFLALYEVTFDAQWLGHAKRLLDYTQRHFLDEASGLFFFTSDKAPPLIRRTIETLDDVIPSSNAVMGHNLWRFHKLFPTEGYGAMVQHMLNTIHDGFDQNAQGFAHWLHLVHYQNQPFYEIAVIGEDYKTLAREIRRYYIPNSLLVGAREEGEIALLKNRHVAGKTLIYVCREGRCNLPVTTVAEALEQMHS